MVGEIIKNLDLLHNEICFLVRLRKREVANIDAIEAGFEPRSVVPRCHSTTSLQFNGSQFQVAFVNRTI